MSEGVQTVQEPSPNELRDPLVRTELKRASVWLGLACAIALAVLLVQPLLIIFAGLVFAAMLDGGVRLLGKVLPIGRGLRLLRQGAALVAGYAGGLARSSGEVPVMGAERRGRVTCGRDQWSTSPGDGWGRSW